MSCDLSFEALGKNLDFLNKRSQFRKKTWKNMFLKSKINVSTEWFLQMHVHLLFFSTSIASPTISTSWNYSLKHNSTQSRFVIIVTIGLVWISSLFFPTAYVFWLVFFLFVWNQNQIVKVCCKILRCFKIL